MPKRPCQSGSSPRGRGTRTPIPRRRPRHRFIPARAGNTRPPTRPLPRPPVHPRAGGEHPLGIFNRRPQGGSSPRGRGTRRSWAPHRARYRFIPARAGNTTAALASASLTAVHPRAGGEHQRCNAPVASAYGSSPRGRGTPCRSSSTRGRPRFIPARAGNTSNVAGTIT